MTAGAGTQRNARPLEVPLRFAIAASGYVHSTSRGVEAMANGRPGDHPINDIVDHGIPVFSPDVDALVRRIAQLLPRYRMWDLIDWDHTPDLEELKRLLERKLAEIEQQARKDGWELDEPGER